MEPLFIGIVLAFIIAVAARILQFDIDRGFYSTVLIVIASYYVLFAFMAGQAVIPEIIAASIFSGVAIIGAFRWPVLIGIGIFAHGIFDFAHNLLISNPGVPNWWPAFCAGVDVPLGIFALYLTISKKGLLKRGRAT